MSLEQTRAMVQLELPLDIPDSYSVLASQNALPFQPKLTSNIGDNFSDGLHVAYGSEGYEDGVSWLIEGILPELSTGIYYGAPGGKKSFLATSLACALANSRNFGELRCDEPRLVFYVAGEGSRGLAGRVKANEDHYGSVGQRIIRIGQPLNLAVHEDAAALAERMKFESKRQGIQAGLVIIDTMSQCAEIKDENNAAEVRKYLSACTMFAIENGVTVLNIHHTNKAGDFRGSTAVAGNVDFLLSSVAKKGKLASQLGIKKMRDAADNIAIDFQLELHGLGINDQYGREMTTLVESSVNVSMSAGDDSPGKQTSKYDRDEYRWLEMFLKTLPSNEIRRDHLSEKLKQTFPEKSWSSTAVGRFLQPLIEDKYMSEASLGKTKLLTVTPKMLTF
ncbi:AAA family ATPase [Pseudoalteromonas sp. PA2MD11]|uniref:AAA family ATPase n=1 Tax=Pseudoalteromonas sp. PA2MD11 TaxID=2785057 RepID=UPI001ADFBD19|nr:AAA family ATPase [Pseudoalteromonas sp. PA2MD11]